MKKALQVIFVWACITSTAIAQDSESGAWYMYFGSNKVGKHLTWHNEIQYRNYNWLGDLEQLLLRTGIGYNLTENNNNVLLGYGFILGKHYVLGEKVKTTEHRIFQQFISKQKIGRVHLQHRYRLEERFTSKFRMRLRYFLGINLPLNKPEMAANTVYLSAYNEVFLNTVSPIFDRNRIYGGLGFKFNGNFRLESGYMFQMYEHEKRGQFQLAFYNTLPFHKNKD